MATKPLKSNSTNSLMSRIKRTKNRTVTFRKPVIEYSEGKVTVLSLSSGSTPIGTVCTTNRKEAERLARSKEVSLRINLDSDYNEQIIADFHA